MISNHCQKKKGWQNWKFPHIFPIFSPSFLPIFSNFSKWQKWNVSITGQQTFARTLWRSKPLFARMNSCCAKNAWFSGCTASASTNPVPAVAMSLKHLLYDISCVCVRMNFSAICLLPRCLWDMGIPKHKRRNATTRPVHLNSTGLFMQKQRVRRWNGAIFSCSTKASNSFTQNARQIETGRSGKRETNKWLYKIQPLRQQKAIAIWPSASEHGYSIHEAKRHSLDYTLRISLRSTAFQRSLFILLAPCAVLQREGFWQHKGLGKHINTYYDFGGEFHPHLQRIGNTEKARLLEVDVYLGCFNWRQRRIDCLKMSITLLSSETALLRMLSDHTRLPPQSISPHILLTRKLCRLIVIAIWKEKRRNREASTFFKSSMFCSSWLFRKVPDASHVRS